MFLRSGRVAAPTGARRLTRKLADVSGPPARVRAAQDLGVILHDEPRTDLPPHEHLHPIMDDWRNRARVERRAIGPSTPSSAVDGAGHPLALTDYQSEFVRFARAINRIDYRATPWRGAPGDWADGEGPQVARAPEDGGEGPHPETERIKPAGL